jgi:hypothetical protein
MSINSLSADVTTADIPGAMPDNQVLIAMKVESNRGEILLVINV